MRNSTNLNQLPSGNFVFSEFKWIGLTLSLFLLLMINFNSSNAQSGCGVTVTVEKVQSFNGADVSCYNAQDGGIKAVPLGGATLNYQYAWSTNTSEPTPGNSSVWYDLGAGTYTVTVTDILGCTATNSITLTNPVALDVVSYLKSDVTCAGEQDGSITDITVSGGTQDNADTYYYTFIKTDVNPDVILQNTDNNEFMNGLTGGTYDLIVNDANNCQVTETITISEKTPIAYSAPTLTHPTCFGSLDGSISGGNASGGAGNYSFEWFKSGQSVGTSADLSGVGAGDYTLVVTDDDDCTAEFDYTLTEPAAIVANVALVSEITCKGADNGTLTVNVSPAGSYTYLWTGPSGTIGTTQSISNLAPGAYTVAVNNAAAPFCPATGSVSGVATLPNDWNYTITSSSHTILIEAAYYGMIGGAQAIAAGDYLGAFAGNLCVGYAVVGAENTVLAAWIDDSYTEMTIDGFVTNDQISFRLFRPLVGEFTNETFGFMQTPGTITDGTYEENGTSVLSSLSFSDVYPTSNIAYNLVEPAALNASATTTDISCNNANDGSIDLSVTGGTIAYTYTWSSGQTTQDLSALAAGTYTVTVKDANNCTTSVVSLVISNPPALAFAGGGALTHVDCFGAASGAIAVVSVNGGTGAYSFEWSTGATTTSLSGLIAGSYDLTVKDANDCSINTSYTITEPVAALAATGTQTNILCNGASTGAIDLSVSGGTDPYSYTWSNANTGQDLTGLLAGTYSVTVTDVNLCTATASFTLTQPDALAIASATLSDFNSYNVSCANGNDGSISLSVTGGNGAYSYAWSNGGSTASVSALNANSSYVVTVTDANGCSVTSSYTLTDPDPIAILPTLTHINCNGASTGAISLSVSGGIGLPYTYNWSNSAATKDISNLPAGTYTVSVSDGNACSVTGSYTLTQSSAIAIVEVISDFNGYEVQCDGGTNGSVGLTVSGGTAPFTYLWSNSASSEDVSGLSAGTYTVTATDAYGCTATETYLLEEPSPMIVQVSATAVSCNGGTNGEIDVTIANAIGNITILWNNGGSAYVLEANNNEYTITGLGSGTYTITVTDENTCSAGSVALATPSWADLPSTDGSHSMIIPNIASLFLAPNVPIQIGDYVGVFFDDNSTLVCGGYLKWEGLNNSFDIKGDDGLTPNDKEGFADGEDFVWKVFRPYAGEFDATVTFDPIANGQASSDDGKYLDEGVSVVTSISSAVDFGSVNITTAVVTQPDVLTVTLAADPIQCNNGLTNVISTVEGGNGGFTYLWSGAATGTSASLTGVAAGTYNVTVTDSKGCTANNSYVVANPSVIIVTVNPTDALCFGDNTGTASASATGGYTSDDYSIDWGLNINPLELYAGTYTVTITDDQGCTATEVYTIGEPADLTITEALTNIACNSASTGAISLAVAGGTTSYEYTWSHGPSTSSLTNLGAGTYTVTVEDFNGCIEIETYTLTQPSALAITNSEISLYNGYSVSCFGSANGSIDITVEGGNPPYTYQWSNNLTTQDVSGLTATNYLVTVTDANNCTVVSSQFSLTQPTALSASAVPTTLYPVTTGGPFNTTCNSMDGAAEVSASGGIGFYSYAWSNNETTAAITELAGGVYSVTITDENACTTVANTTLTSPGPQDVTATINSLYNGYEVSCFNGSNGSVTLTWEGGVSNFDVYWQNWANNSSLNINSNTITVNTFPAGNGYYAIVVDENGCAAISNTVSLTSPEEITLPLISAIPPVCHDGTDGSINITGTIGGVDPYTASWFFTLPTQGFPMPLIGTPNNSGLVVNNVYADATYYGQITDDNGCSKLISVTTTNISEIIVSNIVVDDVDCFGAATGSITADVTGGHTGYTFSTSENGTYTESAVSGLIDGTYDLWVQDAQGCKVVTNNIEIVENTQIVPSDNITHVSCNGGSDGSIEITTVGGVFPYVYEWDYEGIIVDDLTGIPAGTYNLTITDDLNCSRTFTYTVTEPAILAISGSETDILCYNGTNGAIDVTVTGGTTPYTYSWSNSTTTEDLTGLPFGSYTVSVVDAKGCTVSATFELTQPSDYSYATSTVTNVDCNSNLTGEINFEISGGTATYGGYLWSNSAATQDISGLAAGVYTVTFNDANNCAGTYTFTVTEPQELIVNAVGTDITCYNYNDGSISVTIYGGTTEYTFEWQDDALASLNRTALEAGSYTVVVTDAKGCTTSDVVTILNPAAIVLSSASTPVSCNAGADGELEVSIVSGGIVPFTYVWTGSTSTASTAQELVAGTAYGVTVTDDNGCFAILNGLIVTQPDALNASVNVLPELCVDADNGSASVTVSGGNGGYTYQWQGGGTDQLKSDIAPGTYNVVVSDSKSCSVTLEYSIDPAVPLVLTMSSTNASCDNASTGSASVSVTGGNGIYNYNWSNSVATASNANIGTGTYTVTVTDGLGCTAVGSVTVAADFDFNYVNFVSTPVSCNEGTNGSLVVNFDSNQPEHYSFQWYTAANSPIGSEIVNQFIATLSNVAAGTYTLVAYAYPLSIGCSQVYTFTINEPADLDLSATITDALCYKTSTGSIDLTVTGGTPTYTYQWIKGASYISTDEDPSGLRAATYKVIVTDANMCTVEGQYVVEDPAFLNSSKVSTNISCFGENDGSVDLTVIGGTNPFTFLWTGGSTTEDLSSLAPGTYSVTITDDNGCTAGESVVIAEPALLEISDIAKTIENCDDVRLDASVIGGTLPYSFTWASNLNYNPVLSSNDYIEFDGNGTYYLKVVDGNGCIATDSEVVTLANLLTVTVAQTSSSTAVTSVNGGTPQYFYSWSNGFSGVTFSQMVGLSIPNTYTVTVTDFYGCSATDDFTMTNTLPGQDSEIVDRENYLENVDFNSASVSVYPNPSYNGYFMVQVENLDLSSTSVQVLDALGRSIQSTVAKYNHQLEIQIPATVGVYYLQIVTEERTVITKQLIISE